MVNTIDEQVLVMDVRSDDGRRPSAGDRATTCLHGGIGRARVTESVNGARCKKITAAA
jgi:hypothetical protein